MKKNVFCGILLVLAAVSLVVILCDILTTGKIGWSLFAAAGCLLAAGFAAIPAAGRRGWPGSGARCRWPRRRGSTRRSPSALP